VRCGVCPHECDIPEDGEGLCKARGVRDGKLVELVYGRPATIISDEVEKKPLFHFHPGKRALSLGTLGCNVLCSGCQNWQISHASARGEAKKLSYLSPDHAVSMARKHKLNGVVWTYNDPVVWIDYVTDVSLAFKRAGMFTAMVTAGYMTVEALDQVGPQIDAFRFDLKAPGSRGWSWLTKVEDPAPSLEAAIRAQDEYGCHVEVTSNIVPGMNDDTASIKEMAAWVRDGLGKKTPWHLTRFFPDFELSYLGQTPVATLEEAVRLGKKEGLEFVYLSNIPDHPLRDTVCPACDRTLVHRGSGRAEKVWTRGGKCSFCGEELHMVGDDMGSGDAER